MKSCSLHPLYFVLECKVMKTARVSTKFQIVIPSAARKALHIEAGDDLIVVVREGRLVLFPKPKSYAEATKGLMKGKYPPDYLQKERDSWE